MLNRVQIPAMIPMSFDTTLATLIIAQMKWKSALYSSNKFIFASEFYHVSAAKFLG